MDAAVKTYNGYVIRVTVLPSLEYLVTVGTPAGYVVREIRSSEAALLATLNQIKAAIDDVVTVLQGAQATLDTW